LLTSCNSPAQKPRQQVRFDDFLAPPSATQRIPSIRAPSSSITRVQTVRSAALGSLLPVAALEGLAQPLILADGLRATPTRPQPRSSEVDVHRLYICDKVCSHRISHYNGTGTSSGGHELAQVISTMNRVDGTMEVSEKRRDVCWKCTTRDGVRIATGLLLCCFSSKDGRRRGRSHPAQREESHLNI
jgi:hypothetical protein